MKSGLLQRRQTERFGAYEYNARQSSVRWRLNRRAKKQRIQLKSLID